jgi:hypothetical protein
VRVDVENVSNGSAVEALWALGALEPKKWLKRPDGGLGCGGKGAENSSQRRRFLPPAHRYRYRDLCCDLWLCRLEV